MQYVVDFDDLISANLHKLDTLVKAKEKYPGFTATLFTIPRRITPDDIKVVKGMGNWLALAPHGWEHTKGEAISWTRDEALDKLQRARDMGIDSPAFRAPGWLIGRPCYEACEELGITVCSHIDMYIPSPIPQYIYNMPLGRKRGVRACHGHLTPVMDNHILDMAQDGRLTFPNKVEFTWPWEAATPVTLGDDEE